MPDSTRADYVLCDRNGRSLAVIEAKRYSVNPADATEQAKGYARHLNVPYVFLTNGSEVLFWDWQREAFPHPVKTFFKQDDLERRFATHQLRRDPLGVPIDLKIAGRDYQQECIQIASKEIRQGRRKLLLEMATGTGKTRTAAALIKRLFEANAITRVLFLVDRIPLAKQSWGSSVPRATSFAPSRKSSTPRSAKQSTTRQQARRAFWWRPTTISGWPTRLRAPLPKSSWTARSTGAAWATNFPPPRHRPCNRPPSTATTSIRKWCGWRP